MPQLPLIHEVLDALHIPTLQVEGVEADDVIATLADPRRRRRASTSSSSPATATLPARARPAHQGALQPARRLRLRALRRGRDRRAHRRHRRRSTPSTRRSAATRATTCPGVPGHRREDRGQARHHLRRPRGDLRAPRRAAAEAAPEPRRGARPGVPQPRRCRCCAATCDARRRARRPAPGRVGPRAGAGAVRPARLPHPAAPAARGGRRESRPRPTPRPTTLDVEVDVAARRRRGASSGSASSPTRGEPYALEPRWEGAPVHEPRCARIAVAHDDARPRTSTATLLARPGGARRRSPRWSAPGGPPLVAHRAKELMHGLDVDVRTLHHDTAVMAYLLDPGRGEVPARRPRAALPVARGAVARRRARHPRPRRRRRDRADRAARRRRAAARGRARATALEARELTDLYERFELPARARAGADGGGRHPHRPRVPRRAARRARQAVRRRSCGGSTRTRARSST